MTASEFSHRSGPSKRRASRWALLAALGVATAFTSMLVEPTFAEVAPDHRNTPRTVPSQADFSCLVAYVNDGDTLRCQDGTRIRLHAVAARENDETCAPGHPCPDASAAAAKRELERLTLDQTLACTRTGTSYNRVTAICWTPEGVEVNCAMIRKGVAVVWDRFNRQAPLCRT